MNITKVYVGVHPRAELIRNFDAIKFVINDLKVLNGKYPVPCIFYYRIITHSLPKPYETQCFDYKDKNSTSRTDCIQKCRIRLSLQMWPNKWPGIYLNYDNKSALQIMDMYKLYRTIYREDQKIGEQCKAECGLYTECYTERYELSSRMFDQETDLDHTIVGILPPEIPDLIYTHSPSLEWVEFVTYVGSAISLHFGISTVLLSDYILKFITNVVNKTKIKNTFNLHFKNVKNKTTPNMKIISNRRIHSLTPIDGTKYIFYQNI